MFLSHLWDILHFDTSHVCISSNINTGVTMALAFSVSTCLCSLNVHNASLIPYDIAVWVCDIEQSVCNFSVKCEKWHTQNLDFTHTFQHTHCNSTHSPIHGIWISCAVYIMLLCWATAACELSKASRCVKYMIKRVHSWGLIETSSQISKWSLWHTSFNLHCAHMQLLQPMLHLLSTLSEYSLLMLWLLVTCECVHV